MGLGLSKAVTSGAAEVAIDSAASTLSVDLKRDAFSSDIGQTQREQKELEDRAKEIYESLHGGVWGLGDDEERVHRALANLNPDQAERLKDIYKDHYELDLAADLDDQMSGSDLKIALDRLNCVPQSSNSAISQENIPASKELLTPDAKVLADVKELRKNIDEPEVVVELLKNRSFEERKIIMAAYTMEYSKPGRPADLMADINKNLDGIGREAACDLLLKEHLSPAQDIRVELELMDGRKEVLLQILGGKSKEEIKDICLEYKIRYNEDLKERIADDYGGRDQFDLEMALRGRAESIEEQVARLVETQEFEHSGLGSTLVGWVSDKDDLLDGQVKKVTDALEKAKADGTISEEEKEEIYKYLRYAGQDRDSFVGAKDSVVSTAATVGAGAAATVAVVATGGLAAPAAIAIAAGAGAVGYTGTKAATAGAAYDGTGILKDVAIGAVDGAITAITAGAGKALLQAGKEVAEEGAETVAKEGLKKVVEIAKAQASEGAIEGAGGDGIRSITDASTWQNGITAGLATVGTTVVSSAVTGAFTEVATGGISAGTSSATATLKRQI